MTKALQDAARQACAVMRLTKTHPHTVRKLEAAQAECDGQADLAEALERFIQHYHSGSFRSLRGLSLKQMAVDVGHAESVLARMVRS